MRKILLMMAIFLFTLVAPKIVLATTLIPGGENIAFEIYPDGIIVTGSYDVKYQNGTYNPSRDSDIIKGDRIIKIGDNKITDLSSFTSKFYKYKDSGICPITINRKGSELNRNLYLIDIDSSIKTGLYVKERILGVGTTSFYDPVNKRYGALAHEVYDNDSQSIIDVRVGKAYLEEVESISKSTNGNVGSKNSELTFEDQLGNIEANTKFGIFGDLEEIPSSYQPIEVANWDQVKLGKAIIRTCLNDDKVSEYEIQITSLKKQYECDVKGISFEITDKTLLTKTGGIYQGMSGSPIIQNNMLVGAVTHVNVDNVKTGFGVYMQYMYQISLECH